MLVNYSKQFEGYELFIDGLEYSLDFYAVMWTQEDSGNGEEMPYQDVESCEVDLDRCERFGDDGDMIPATRPQRNKIKKYLEDTLDVEQFMF